MLPSNAELEYFIEVANSLNFSRAAVKIGISQPSLSVAMSKLENTLGAKLFVRHKTGVSLTQAGKQLLLHSKQLLQYWENTKSQALASQTEIQGHFVLGCNSIVATYLLSNILPDLLEKYPKLLIQLKHDVSRKITEQVVSLSVDIGIVINPIRHPDLIITRLGKDETKFWSSKKSRKIQDLNSENCVVIGNMDSMQAKKLLSKVNKLHTNLHRIISTESMEVIASLTAQGCGIGILPERMVKTMYPNKLHAVANMPVYSDDICLVYRNENRQIQAIQTIVNAIKAYFKM